MFFPLLRRTISPRRKRNLDRFSSIEIAGTLSTAKIHNHFSRMFDVIIFWLAESRLQDWIGCITSSAFISLSIHLFVCLRRKGFFCCHWKLNFSKAIYITNAIAFSKMSPYFEFPVQFLLKPKRWDASKNENSKLLLNWSQLPFRDASFANQTIEDKTIFWKLPIGLPH